MSYNVLIFCGAYAIAIAFASTISGIGSSNVFLTDMHTFFPFSLNTCPVFKDIIYFPSLEFTTRNFPLNFILLSLFTIVLSRLKAFLSPSCFNKDGILKVRIF